MKVMLAVSGISPCGEVVKAVVARPWPSGSSFCLLNVLDPYPFVRTPALLERAGLLFTIERQGRRAVHLSRGEGKQGASLVL